MRPGTRLGALPQAPGRLWTRRLLASVAVATVSVWSGCALVIDLGDEAQLRASDGGGGSDSGPSLPITEGGTTDSAPIYKCGLQTSANAACAACIETECCEESKECAADPACSAGLDCIKDCMAQIECIARCLTPQLQKVTDCSSRKCALCTPQQKCFELGDCCYATYPLENLDPGEKILRDVCRGVILDVNEQACADYEPVVGARANASPRCARPPSEAGADQ